MRRNNYQNRQKKFALKSSISSIVFISYREEGIYYELLKHVSQQQINAMSLKEIKTWLEAFRKNPGKAVFYLLLAIGAIYILSFVGEKAKKHANPDGEGEGSVIVRITVLGSDGIPLEDAQVWSSVGGEAKKVAGGWELEIQQSKLPQNRKIIIYASQKSAYLKGHREIIVGKRNSLTTSIRLEHDTSAQVKGNVYGVSEAVGKDIVKNPIAGATVSIVGSAGFTTTDTNGFFSLPAFVAEDEEIRLHISKTGYVTKEQYHPAGNTPAYIVLQRIKQ
jgi:hypothetical protein